MPQQILVLGRSETPNLFAGYMREILATEGLPAWEFHDIANPAPDLSAFDIVILEHAPVDENWISLLNDYVRSGGRLIASRPAREMAQTFGIKPFKSFIKTCQDLYITFDGSHPLSANLGAESIQFRGLMDLYEIVSAKPLAVLGGQLGVKTNIPAITINEHGDGLAAAFMFDLADCVVRLHQGTPLNASDGPNPDPNADGAFKPDDLFYKHLDERLKTVPQADIHCNMLVRLIRFMAKQPTPRLWRFPKAAPSVALLDGDSDSMTTEHVERVFEIVGRHDGKYTIYLMPEHYDRISPKRMSELREQGHDAGPHTFAGRMPAPKESAEAIRNETEAFRARFGFQPLAHRGHNVIWIGWVDHAQELSRNGIRLDTDFCCGAALQYGYLNGSGQPVRFVDENGEIIDIYEQATLSVEDGWYTEKCFLPTMSVPECIALSIRQIDDAADKWHAVYHPCFHPVYVKPGEKDSSPWIDAVAEHISRRGLPFVNGSEWVAFNDARRAVSFSKIEWDAESGELTLCVRAEHDIEDLTILLPAEFDRRRAQTSPDIITVNLEGIEQTACIASLKAREEKVIKSRYK